MRLAVAAVVVVGIAGCLHPNLVDCGDGRACAEGTVCATLTANGEQLCVASAQVSACAGAQQFDSCTLASGAMAACYAAKSGLVCLASGCGNGLVDPQLGEVCDDGNAIIGDGCSDSCKSNETCGNGVLDPIRIDAHGDPIPNEQCDDGNNLGHDGCSPGCAAETARWEQLVFEAPAARGGHAIVYDSLRDRLVMFGGLSRNGLGEITYINDTSELANQIWGVVPTPLAPPPRANMGLAYDSIRARTVMFGGTDGVARDDTWLWDGALWTPIYTATAPSPRTSPAMAFDPIRGATVLVGGAANDGTLLADTWAWDGAAWRMVATTNPPPARSGASLVFDPKKGVLVLAGGAFATGLGTVAGGDTWQLAGTTWTRLDATGAPLAVVEAGAITWDPNTQSLITTAGNPTQTWAWTWTGAQWIQLASAPPGNRFQTAIAADATRGRVVMFGGEYETGACGACPPILNDTWIWNGTVWTQETAIIQSLPTLFGAAVAADPLTGTALLFGGQPSAVANSYSQQSWLLDHTWTQIMTSTSPPARTQALIAYDAMRRNFVMYGGTAIAGSLSDTWTYANGVWKQYTGPGPGVWSAGAMAFDLAAALTVLYTGTSGQTWEWNGAQWHLASSASAPGLPQFAAMAYDPQTQHVVMFGGHDGNNVLDHSLWSWDHASATWSLVTSGADPGGRALAGLAWNGGRRRLTLFGGGSTLGPTLNDSWEWDGSEWLPVVTTPPPIREYGAFVPNVDGHGDILVGGFDPVAGLSVGDVWRLRWDGGGGYEPCTVNLDLDGDGLAGCADPDCWARCTPLCPPGAPCDSAWPHCGDGVCNAVLESCRLCPQDCGACPGVCGDSFCDPGESAATCPGDCH